MVNFNPRSPRGERPITINTKLTISSISIHALREESDSVCKQVLRCYINFNPRSPRGERHDRSSIMDVFRHFNPRSPRGERLTVLNPNVCIIGFQSTLSARRATEASIMFNARDFDFNPRSPRGERRCRGVVAFLSNGFQSTLSARRATLFKFFEVFKMFISIHALREESDLNV